MDKFGKLLSRHARVPIGGERSSCAVRVLPIVLAVAMLGACATSPQGRLKITAPAPLGDIYSEADMRLHLASATSIDNPCAGGECTLNQEFDQQVQQLGARLAEAALDSHPDLTKRISRFEFVVAEKEEAGSVSNAKGTVVIFRGVQQLHLREEALAFLIAREMGHVIARHHDENSATRIAFSVLIGVLFPAANLFNGSAAAAQATSATSATSFTTLTTTAASTATSYIGSKVVLAHIKPEQLNEADSIALGLLDRLGLNRHDVAAALEPSVEVDGDNAWVEDFRFSVAQLKTLEQVAEAPDTDLNASPLDFQVASTELDAQAVVKAVERASESGRITGEGIRLAGATDVPSLEGKENTIPAIQNDGRLESHTTVAEKAVTIAFDKGVQPDASGAAVGENLQGSNVQASSNGGEEVAEADLKEDDDMKIGGGIAAASAEIVSGSGDMNIAADGRVALAGSKSGTAKRDTKVSARGDKKRLAAKGVKRGTTKVVQARSSKKSPLARKSIKTAQVNKGLQARRDKAGIQQGKQEPGRSNTKLADTASGGKQNMTRQERQLHQAAALLKEIEIKKSKKAAVSSNKGALLVH